MESGGRSLGTQFGSRQVRPASGSTTRTSYVLGISHEFFCYGPNVRLSTLAWISTMGLSAAACGDGTSSGAGGTNAGGAGGAGAATATGGSGAGGAATNASPRYASGSRLKARVVRAGDAEAFREIFDDQLQLVCEPQLDPDGVLRCMPSDNVQAVVFRDAACSDAIVADAALPPGCPGDPTPTYATAITVDASGCEPVFTARVYEVGAQLASPPATLYLRDGDSCVEIGGTLEVFHELTKVPTSLFVPMEAVTEPRGPELTVTYLRSDDGFRLIEKLPIDSARGEHCLPLTLGTTLGCAPLRSFGITPAYSDMGCSVELGGGVVSYPTTCTKPDAVIASAAVPQDQCQPELHVYEVSADVPPAFVSYDGFCGPAGPPDASYAELSAQIPDDALPAFEYVDEGTGPIRFRTEYAGGAPITRNGEWYSSIGVPCSPYPFDDGITRCGPLPIARVDGEFRFYADAVCSQLLTQIPNDVCLPPGASIEYAVVEGAEACAGSQPHLLGAAHTGPVYFQDAVGCTEVPADPAVTYHLVGAAAPNSDFVEMTLVTL